MGVLGEEIDKSNQCNLNNQNSLDCSIHLALSINFIKLDLLHFSNLLKPLINLCHFATILMIPVGEIDQS